LSKKQIDSEDTYWFRIRTVEVEVTGTGSATPPGKKFPGTYDWRDPGILINTKYTSNKYVSPFSFTLIDTRLCISLTNSYQ
jgi:hypothetical protein